MNEHGVSTSWHENERLGERLHLKPTPPMSSQVWLDTMLDDYPVSIRARGWLGLWRGWLSHPKESEREVSALALKEIDRLREEAVRCGA